MPKLSFVTTTINEGLVIDSYLDRYINYTDVSFIVIPDLKSPKVLFDNCQNLSQRGYDIICPTVLEQNQFLRKLHFPAEKIPQNSDNRRNVGYLMALERGSDVIISIDDDNYYDTQFKEHCVVTEETISLPGLYNRTGWINICHLLEFETAGDIYPRGFPYHQRYKNSQTKIHRTDEGRVRLNIGLWRGAPDVDAISWLSHPTEVTRFCGDSFLIGEHMWTPINTQNTGLHRDLIVTYYYVKMGAGIDRFGDIFSGYFCQKCVQHMGDRIRVGTPITNHVRNSHNYLDDLQVELKGILILEELLPWLQDVRLAGSTYTETYLSLIDALRIQIDKFKGRLWTSTVKGYFYHVIDCMKHWAEVCKRIG